MVPVKPNFIGWYKDTFMTRSRSSWLACLSTNTPDCTTLGYIYSTKQHYITLLLPFLIFKHQLQTKLVCRTNLLLTHNRIFLMENSIFNPDFYYCVEILNQAHTGLRLACTRILKISLVQMLVFACKGINN